MSGHNPHNRLGQPNASFNLQVPFIPRQPQLAHVHMNDSILRSSPLNWHQSDAAFLNYMSTQHKTPLDLNPFVRPPVANAFGTVDLSFPAHHRHNSTPSPHNVNNTAVSDTAPLEFPSPYSSKSMLNSSTALPSPNSVKDVMSNGTTDKIANNGSEKLTGSDAVTPSNLTTGLFVAHHLNDATKNSGWNSSTPHNEPIELIKEKILKNFQELIERNATTESSLLLNPAASILAGLPPNSSINNNTSAQRLGELPSSNHANTSNSHNTSRDSQATTSNDDSVDSNAGKKRRRRKPNKTCRLSNNDNGTDDDDGGVKTNKHSDTSTTNELPIDARLADTVPNVMNNGSKVGTESSATVSSECEKQLAGPPRASLESSHSVTNADTNVTNDGARDGSSSATDSRSVEFSSPVTRKRRSVSRLSSPNEMSQDNNSNGSNSSNQRRPGKRKLDVDADCETIDKIAAMIASPEFNPKNGQSTPVPTSSNVPTLENGPSKDVTDAKEASAQPVDQKDQRFVDVEIKLEEMFAGIEDDVDRTKVKSTKLEGCKELRVAIESLGSLEAIIPKMEKKKKGRPKLNKNTATTSSAASDETDHKAKKPTKRLPKTKTKKGKGKKANSKPVKGNCSTGATDNNKKTKIKEETPDTTSKFRGPFIHVKTDGSSNVVNAPITEEIAENKAKVKKTLTNPNHNDRSKIRGLHVSTLSMKYDASTTDKSWMCVFCKMGPHKCGLGDLFGPYILSTTGEDFELSQIDPAEDAFKSKKTKANTIQKRTLPATAVGGAAPTGHKRKRKATEPIPSTSTNSSIHSQSSCGTDAVDIFEGMTKTTDTSYEVWVHGDCAVWSNGVYLIGPRIVGLDAAVWGSTRYRCSGCQNYGAMLCCFKRGCGDVAHVPCARKAKWNLSDENFQILCDKHCERTDKIETVKQTA
ncbi:uncharacterized protein CG5098 isoform X1 [Bradysia coprophila]|uniref:uncharacterized protein CG5098 isoform X1 n=1 Tax=Bradysia coprophila TaxID=38358 RepID=UPI00187D8D21|nr:uncharacterized protein CG5098 isoform X1 [Bradysia coprophila]